MTWSNLATGIAHIWDKTNFIGKLITDTQAVYKNVTLSYNMMSKIKKWVGKAVCGKTSFRSDGRESIFHDNIILAANAKARFDVYSFISPQFSRTGQLGWQVVF